MNTETFFDKIFEGNFNESEVKQKLTGMYQRGETVEEILAAAKSMRNYMGKINVDSEEDLLDIVGTGGDGKSSINISTISALVAAGAGCKIAKHCNRGASSKFGSVDLLDELGINVNLEPEQTKQIIETIGIGFMYAPIYHPAMKNVSQIRKDLGHRTIFNLLGPLTNPANPQTMLIGAYSTDAAEKLAHAINELGTKKTLIVYGHDGLDEISLHGGTTIFEVESENIRKYVLDLDYNLPNKLIGLEVSSAEESAEICKKILYAQKLSEKEDVMRKSIILNAGMAIYVNKKSETQEEGLRLAQESIQTGAAKQKLEELIKSTNSF